LLAILAWQAAVVTLSSPTYSKITRGDLAIGLLEVPYCGSDIANLDDICQEFFSRFPARLEAHEAQDRLTLSKYFPRSLKFPGTVHAEATLMGLLTYFSDSSKRVAYETVPLGDHLVAALEQLLQPVSFMTSFAGIDTYYVIVRQLLRRPSQWEKSVVGVVTVFT